MEIKKGEFYRCTELNSVANLIAGKVYKSEEDGFITGEEGQQYNVVLSKFDRLYSIYDLANGHCAVNNDGTTEQLDRVLKAAGYGIVVLSNASSYVLKGGSVSGGKLVEGFPRQSVKDFIIQLPKEATKDDLVKEAKAAARVMMDMMDPVLTFSGTVSGSMIPTSDPITPRHYQFKIKGQECDLFDIIHAMDLDTEQATALRYFRKKKDPIEDAKKAIKCLERYVERLEQQQSK